MLKHLIFFALLCGFGLCENESSLSNEVDSSSGNDDFQFGTRIIGGETAKPGEYLYVTRLLIYFTGQGWSLCSGTILSDRLILTAGHCVYSQGKKASLMWALFNRNSNQYTYISSSEMYPHPGYNDKFSDDIAIIKLSSGRLPARSYGTLPVLLTSDLANNMNIRGGAVVAGWGKTSDNGDVSSTLQFANVNIIHNFICSYYYGSIVTEKTVCTLDVKSRICGGDSGGPLMITRNGRNYLVGVNAFGSSKCEAVYPSGYTYVAAYTDWIKSIIQ